MKRFLSLWLFLGLVFCASFLSAKQIDTKALKPSGQPLGLAEAISSGVLSSEDLQISKTQIDEKHGEKWQSYALFLPSIRGSYRYSFNALKQDFVFATGPVEVGADHVHTFRLELSQPLFGFGSIRHGLLAASFALDAVQSMDVQNQANFVFKVKQAYYQALLAGHRVATARFIVDESRERLKREKSRFGVGEIAEFDLNRANLDLQIAETALVNAQGDLALLLKELKRLVGIPLDRSIYLTDTLEEFAAGLWEQHARSLLNLNHPVLKAASQKEQSLDEARLAARAQFFPQIGSYLAFQSEGQSSNGFFPKSGDFSNSLGLGLQMQVPLFDGMATIGRYRAATARAARASFERKQTEKDLALGLEQLLTQAQVSLRNKKTEAESLRLADKLYAQAKLRYQNGLISLTDLKEIQKNLEETRLRYFTSLYEYVLTLAKLEQILGGKLGES